VIEKVEACERPPPIHLLSDFRATISHQSATALPEEDVLKIREFPIKILGENRQGLGRSSLTVAPQPQRDFVVDSLALVG